MLFRPEEIVLASSAAAVGYAIFREHANQLTLVRFYMYSVNAMGAGVVKLDMVVPVLAADQQQEIDCSRDAECLLVI